LLEGGESPQGLIRRLAGLERDAYKSFVREKRAEQSAFFLYVIINRSKYWIYQLFSISIFEKLIVEEADNLK
jgi:hypothetical protein